MKNREKLRAITQTAMFTAVMAVLAQLALPMPSQVPLTLQTFGIALCARLGGRRLGLPALLIYLLAGAAGMPVFSGFRGGFGILLGHTGGFLWGFIPLALCCTVQPRRKGMAVLTAGIGLCCCHAFGILQYCAVTDMDVLQAFFVMSAPYLAKDAISLYAAYPASHAIRRAVQVAGIKL